MTQSGLRNRFLDSTRGQVASLLRRGPRTVEELATELGLTDNAVRNHLALLERDGMVRQVGVRRVKGAGKPATIFELDPAAEPQFSRAYPPVLSAVLDVLIDELPAERAVEILDKVGRRLGAGAGGPATGSLADRAERAADALRALGAEVDVVTEEGALVLRGAGCPLSSVVRHRPETCRAVESFVSEIVGTPVRECCARDDRPRCRFVVQPAA